MLLQDEAYNHIDSADMDKVRAATLEKRTWMNAKFQAQALLTPCVDPAVRCSLIIAEKNVRTVSTWHRFVSSCFIVSYVGSREHL